MRKLLLFAALLSIIVSCKKDKKDKPTGTDKVEFYLLESTQLVTNRCEIDGSRSTLSSSALITNDEIEGYDTKKHEFKLSPSGWRKMQELKDKMSMAVTVNKQVVYYVFYKPMHSSSSCEHSITMHLWYKAPPYFYEDRVQVSLGYPGDFAGIDDQRNASVLVNALAGQGKLL